MVTRAPPRAGGRGTARVPLRLHDELGRTPRGEHARRAALGLPAHALRAARDGEKSGVKCAVHQLAAEESTVQGRL